MEFYPDVWVIIKILQPAGTTIYKVLTGNSGGYCGGDSWKINSGIASYEINEDSETICFRGVSGSTYVCNPSLERLSGLTSMVLDNLITHANMVGGKVEQIDFEDFVKEFVPR